MASHSADLHAASDKTLEGLSSLVDGEVTDFESRRLLTMANEPALEAKWQSYHLAGALMRKELEGAPLKDLSATISSVLANEPAHSATPEAPLKAEPVGLLTRWQDVVAKTAIAASVAFAVVVGVQYTQGDKTDGAQAIAAQAAPVTAPTGFDLPSPVARNVSLGSLAGPQQELQSAVPASQQFLSNAEVEAELQQLFLEHAELSSQNGKFSLMPMARAAKMQALDE